MKQEFNIGDKVKVVNTNMNFCYYDKWASEQGLIKFLVGEVLVSSSVGVVVAKAPHSVSGNFTKLYGTIYGIEILGKQFIVDGSCLELEEKQLTIPSFLASMQPSAQAGVYQEVGKYTVIVYGQEFYADTEERLQEVMKAVHTLYFEE